MIYQNKNPTIVIINVFHAVTQNKVSMSIYHSSVTQGVAWRSPRKRNTSQDSQREIKVLIVRLHGYMYIHISKRSITMSLNVMSLQ